MHWALIEEIAASARLDEAVSCNSPCPQADIKGHLLPQPSFLKSVSVPRNIFRPAKRGKFHCSRQLRCRIELANVHNNIFCFCHISGKRVARLASTSISVGSSLGARELFTRRDTGHACSDFCDQGRSISGPALPASHASN